jgi:hypothetical protein
MEKTEDLVERLRKRAAIRMSIPTRKSAILGEPDRLVDLLEESANEIERLRYWLELRSGGCTWIG